MFSKKNRADIAKELTYQNLYQTATKDILMVNLRRELIKPTFFKIKNLTSPNSTFHVWLNCSSKENIGDKTYRSETNLGFIEPCNKMAAACNSEFLILLNDDVVLSQGWDTAMIGFLQNNIDYDLVGYSGGELSENFVGRKSVSRIDYIEGWCLCVRNSFVKQQGFLFDPNLKFAYGEDSDLSLRIRNSGRKIHKMSLEYAMHIGGGTVKTLNGTNAETFKSNHEYLKNKWKFL